MEKFIRVSDMNKEHAKVYTAEEITDAIRGVARWFWNGTNYVCSNCGCGSHDHSHFCKYCGAKMVGDNA